MPSVIDYNIVQREPHGTGVGPGGLGADDVTAGMGGGGTPDGGVGGGRAVVGDGGTGTGGGLG